MTEIYLIRHIQAEGNLYRAMQGSWDGDVTDEGLQQRDALAERFKNVNIDALYSSDLYRARVTAGAIQKYHKLELHTESTLREMNCGVWETEFFGNIVRDGSEMMRRFIFDVENWHVDGAEYCSEVTERMYAALEAIAKAHDGQTVAVVSHGAAIRCFLSKITGIPMNGENCIKIGGNTSVSKIYYDKGKFSLEYMCDLSHLPEQKTAHPERDESLWDEPIDPFLDAKYYTDCYSDAWLAAHGNLSDFSPRPYLDSAIAHYRKDARSVLRIGSGDEAVGLVDMDTERGAGALYGWISLLYLRGDMRGRGLGVQLLGRAVMHYRELGRRALRLHVAEDNAAAIAFYKKYGFTVRSEESNTLGHLLLMEKNIGGRHV